MSNFIPDSMRSGSGGFFITGGANTIEEVVLCIVFVLVKDTLTKMIEYFVHIGVYNDLSEIPVETVKDFLKLSTMMFIDTPDINERIQTAIQRYHMIISNFDEEMMDIDNVENWNMPNEPLYNCNCDMCNIVDNIDIMWDNFNPTDGFIILLKMKIDDFDVSQIFN